MDIQNTINNSQAAVQFKGLLKPKDLEEANHFVTYLANSLKQGEGDIVELLGKKPKKNATFLDFLAKKFNNRYFGKSIQESEDPRVINRIFESVEKPTDAHYSIIDSTGKKPFEYVERVFNEIGRDKAKQKLAEVVTAGIEKKELPQNEEFLFDLLKSPNQEKYAKNFDEYSAYFRLNKEDEKAVENLDALIASGQYDANVYKNQAKLNDLFTNIESVGSFTPKTLATFYSEEGNTLVENFGTHYLAKLLQEKEGNDKIMTEIYKTTNDKNFSIRNKFMEILRKKAFSNGTSNKDGLSDTKKLFDTIDTDKHARSFIEKQIKTDSLLSAAEYNELFETIPSRKLNIFHSNAENIISQTNKKERVGIMKAQLENPFFETEETMIDRLDNEFNGLSKKESIFSKGFKALKNSINKLRYGRVAEEVKPAKVETPFAEEVKAVAETPVVEEIKTAAETVAEKPVKPRRLHIARKPKAVSASKLQVINDVNNVIESKLGAKTLEEQKAPYANYATKVRLSILPDAFESVKATRKAERLAGKKKPSVSNADVIELYRRVNGNNKKLVNYMLNKCNEDGTRIYSINDIISALDNASKETKALDAKGKKEYFKNLYNAQVEEFGKLPKKPRAKKKA